MIHSEGKVMKYERLHFVFEPGKEPAASFARTLVEELGQCDIKDADVIICVGGDGLLLHTLPLAEGKPVYGITAPASNSSGFWLDHDVDSAEKLLANLAKASAVQLAPLEAEIRFADGTKTLCHAFNSLAIERAAGQAVLMYLHADIGAATLGPYRIMGDGFIFSTAMGSTGLNRSYGGPSVDLHNDVTILTGKGLYEPRGIAPVVTKASDSKFRIDFGSSAHKRPVRLDYDGHSIERNDAGSAIDGVSIRSAAEKSVTMLVTAEPGIKAFAAFDI
jgi:NAD+ kinase